MARIGWRISQSKNTVNIDYVIVYVEKVDVRCRPLLQSSYDLHAELAGSGGGSGDLRRRAGPRDPRCAASGPGRSIGPAISGEVHRCCPGSWSADELHVRKRTVEEIHH